MRSRWHELKHRRLASCVQVCTQVLPYCHGCPLSYDSLCADSPGWPRRQAILPGQRHHDRQFARCSRLAAQDSSQARVFLHIGEPKTGTTFLQQVMWSNRAELAAQGVVLPGHHPQDHFRASQDLRGIEKRADDPAGSWAGEWEILAHQARQAPRAAVISHELLSALDAQQAGEAVRSLQPAEVHVVLTVRDMAS